MNFKFSVGERVLIELNTNQIFEADVTSCGKNSIEVRNIVEYNTNTEIEGSVMVFYRSEIHSIRQLGKPKISSDDSGVEENGAFIKIPKCNFGRLRELSQSFIYMATMDSRYHKAIEHIHQTENLGIVTLGNGSGRGAAMSLLVVATWDQVYLFDLQLYNCKHFPKELKFIFVSKDIKKIVHDSRATVDCLHHCYGGKMNHYFDTKVADRFIRRRKNPDDTKYHDIGKCLSDYFNYPENFLSKPMAAELGSWSKRPLTNSKKMYASELATYLITLKNHLESLLLKDFYEETHEFSNSTVDSSPVNLSLSSNS